MTTDNISIWFEKIGEGLSQFFEMLGEGFQGLEALILLKNAETGAIEGVTFLGGLLIVVLVFGIGWLIFRMVRGLIKMNG